MSWRQTREQVTQDIANAKYLDAREGIQELKRLARATDSKKQTDNLIAGFNKPLQARVDAAKADIARQQFDQAYATLIEIARLSDARQAASDARSTLREHQALDGMKQAKVEYDAAAALAGIKGWYSQIASPSKNEQQQYLGQLASVASRFPGTRAAEQVDQMLAGSDNKQAAR